MTRHTYARLIGEESGDFMAVFDELGHKNPGTTRVYLPSVTIKKDRFSSQISKRLGL
jgi:site-specific recombinase XerC